jgi:hypothetical protein
MKNQDLSILKALLLKEIEESAMCNECGGPMYEGMCTECGYMEEVSYDKSGLKNPKLADRNKDGDISSWEEKVGSAIEKNMSEASDKNISYLAGYADGALQGYEKGYFDGLDGKKYDVTGITKPKNEPKVEENHEGAELEEKVDMEELQMTLNSLKKKNPGKEVTYSFVQNSPKYPKGYVFHIKNKDKDKKLVKEDLMSTLGGERPYGDKEMREKIVEPNLGKNYDTYIMFKGPKGQYDQVKNKYVKDMENWKPLYRSSNYQGNAYLSPDGNVIKAAILDQGGVVGAIYVKKQEEISENHEGQDHEVSEGLGNDIGDKVYFKPDSNFGKKFPSSKGYYAIIQDVTPARNYNMNALYKVVVHDKDDNEIGAIRADWTNFSNKPINENHEGTDHEVSMANNSIDSIIWAAHELKKHLQGGERDIPAWIQDHITNSENYILQAAKNYHEYGSEEAPEEEPIADEMSLQEMIKKVGKKYNVYSKKGKKLGSHPSKKKAQKQMAAIEISKQGK